MTCRKPIHNSVFLSDTSVAEVWQLKKKKYFGLSPNHCYIKREQHAQLVGDTISDAEIIWNTNHTSTLASSLVSQAYHVIQNRQQIWMDENRGHHPSHMHGVDKNTESLIWVNVETVEIFVVVKVTQCE